MPPPENAFLADFASECIVRIAHEDHFFCCRSSLLYRAHAQGSAKNLEWIVGRFNVGQLLRNLSFIRKYGYWSDRHWNEAIEPAGLGRHWQQEVLKAGAA